MLAFLKTRTFRFLVIGVFAGAILLSITAKVFMATSETSFCISCHEMQVLAEQGWMKSAHYQNKHGVVAECADCHIEPELLGMIWTKTRDGIVDAWVHNTGESDPHQMDWERLEKIARSRIRDSSCKRCHENITPKGAPIKMIIAHRAYDRMNGRKRCVDCHTSEFHGKFKTYLFGQSGHMVTKKNGGDK